MCRAHSDICNLDEKGFIRNKPIAILFMKKGTLLLREPRVCLKTNR